jgi:co-chaperonin GroES (HSP10)
MSESFTPFGSTVLCRRADSREQMKGKLAIPVQGSGGKKFKEQGQGPRVLELIVVAAGGGEGLDENGKDLMAAFQTGQRVAVANAPVSVIYLNGDEHILIDGQYIEGVVQVDTQAIETA